jgi:hydroxymethylglutaryl-CoA reductase (NADPH)
MQNIGPIKIIGPVANDSIMVPLATFEAPLWPSVNRGARVTRKSEGIRAVIIDERMTRSVLLQASNAEAAFALVSALKKRREELNQVTAGTSRFATLLDIHSQITADLIFLRFEISTGDAAGHNMATKAADHITDWILHEYPEIRYVSISGNYCTDKKVSAVNAILGRGKNVIAEMLVPEAICRRYLRTTPEKIVELNIKKNFIGSILAGGVHSANAHFANMLLAFYLATGQDAANIIEGSQGITHAEVRQDHLYFSVSLPNIILGTVGSGKEQDFVRQNLTLMGCTEERATGENARRLAAIAAATVLCGELSLLAALTNRGELVRTHEKLERT